MIDSHCHLADAKFDTDREEVIRRAVEAGVKHMVCIADTLNEAEKCKTIAESHPEIFSTAGVHPHTAKDWKKGDDDRLRTLLRTSSKMKAVGEIGLDYHYDFSPRDVQKTVFSTQLQIAKDMDLPVVVHCREAVDDVWEIVHSIKPISLVIHCCTERWEDVVRFIDRGYHLSFTGIATYVNAGAIRECIRMCPLESMMIETDAPYLTPAPRGKIRNEPAFVTDIAELIAELKSLSVAELDAITTKNTVEFFHLPPALLEE